MEVLCFSKDIMVTGNKMPFINYNKKFKDALKIMNKKKLGIVVILKKYIKGIVTDGDLREMKNYTLENNLNKFMTSSPLVVNENMQYKSSSNNE